MTEDHHATRHAVALFSLLLLAISVWVIVLLLLLEVSRQLLDTLRFIVELGAMN
jgi:hypothetical protein